MEAEAQKTFSKLKQTKIAFAEVGVGHRQLAAELISEGAVSDGLTALTALESESSSDDDEEDDTAGDAAIIEVLRQTTLHVKNHSRIFKIIFLPHMDGNILVCRVFSSVGAVVCTRAETGHHPRTC